MVDWKEVRREANESSGKDYRMARGGYNHPKGHKARKKRERQAHRRGR